MSDRPDALENPLRDRPGSRKGLWKPLCVAALLVAAVQVLAYFSPGDAAGGSRFIPGAGPLGPVIDTLIFGLLAFGALVWALWALCRTGLQEIALPFHDELVDCARKWRAGELTEADAWFAVACAICEGFRIWAVLYALSYLAAQ